MPAAELAQKAENATTRRRHSSELALVVSTDRSLTWSWLSGTRIFVAASKFCMFVILLYIHFEFGYPSTSW